ncbi:MAG TPA: hypothetical protein VH092_21500, partial [Urbifossiella sp.]|nr:hypothetical protein [Urbifossiella sp.]
MTHTPPAPAVDAAAFGDELARARLLPADRLVELLGDFPGGGAADLATHLVARGALTRFQADRALAGAAKSLVLGPYRVTGRYRVGVLGPTFTAEKTGRGAAGPVALVAVPLRSLWRAKQARELARRMAAVRPHPAVVTLADADSANGFHYLAWPLAHGERLADRVAAGGPLPPGKVAAVLAQLAAGLAACHAAGLAHGLFSPAAVALPAGGAAARVLDLGAGLVLAGDLAGGECLLDTLTGSGALARFFPYAAPEWLAAPGAPTPAADQYSLGAVGYFALTGRPPSPGGDDPAVVPGVTRDLVAALDRLMAADPATRFSGLDEASAALTAAAGAADPVDFLGTDSVLGTPAPQPGTGSSQGGSVSWGAGLVRPPDRDDTDDSIQFDLPEEGAPAGLNGPPSSIPVPLPPTWDPRPTPRPPPKSPAPVDAAPADALPA